MPLSRPTWKRPPSRRASRACRSPPVRRRARLWRLRAFPVELEDLLLVLLGQLQPDEQPGKDDERDHDQSSERDAERDRHGLESLHPRTSCYGGWVLLAGDVSRPALAWVPGRAGGAMDRGRPDRRCRRG